MANRSIEVGRNEKHLIQITNNPWTGVEEVLIDGRSVFKKMAPIGISKVFEVGQRETCRVHVRTGFLEQFGLLPFFKVDYGEGAPQDSSGRQAEGKAGFPSLWGLSWRQQIAAGWPLVMIFFGGAVGGALGGLAYLINGQIFHSKMKTPLKYVFSFLTGVWAVLMYVVAIGVLAACFPGIFKQPS